MRSEVLLHLDEASRRWALCLRSPRLGPKAQRESQDESRYRGYQESRLDPEPVRAGSGAHEIRYVFPELQRT